MILILARSLFWLVKGQTTTLHECYPLYYLAFKAINNIALTEHVIMLIDLYTAQPDSNIADWRDSILEFAHYLRNLSKHF